MTRELGDIEFHRREERHVRRGVRELACGHVIAAREPYVYTVQKIAGVPGLVQLDECDRCHAGDAYRY